MRLSARAGYSVVNCSWARTLDTDNIEAGYDAGVLRLTIPLAERAKPRKIEISSAGNSNGSSKEVGHKQESKQIDA